jgi:phospholipid-translocating ATPase
MVVFGLILIFFKGGNYDKVHIQLFRYILLLSTIIPISMKVNHDISRLFYSSRINTDEDIPGCQARNGNTMEDLGRIEYFLTDKTGTLTKNIMVVRKLFVRDVGLIREQHFKSEVAKYRGQASGPFRDFTTCMMVCHSVSPTKDHSGKRALESSSPDEISFIEMMERDGFNLREKTERSVAFIDESGKSQTYTILEAFPFTSERKRMGLICKKEGDTDLTYFLKGADSCILPKLHRDFQDLMMKQAEDLSSEGLRTLALAKRMIKLEDFTAWKKDFDVAKAAMKKRTERMEACIELLEKDMDLIGVSLPHVDHCCGGPAAGQRQALDRAAPRRRHQGLDAHRRQDGDRQVHQREHRAARQNRQHLAHRQSHEGPGAAGDAPALPQRVQRERGSLR